MASAGKSLRTMVQDWLAPDPTRGFRVSHYGRSIRGRYVCVVAVKRVDPMVMLFYRHRDGKWYVFPPEPERPAMRLTQVS